jgi:hypothetical protein
MRGFHRRTGVVAALVAAGMLAPARVATQEQFQFFVSARDADGRPVTDLKSEEIRMFENGVANQIVKVEPFRTPVKLTIAVDNGILSRNALAHYRSGLEGLVKALPPEIEVALVTMAPQPRFVVTSTLDRARIMQGISSFAPESATPRFFDTLVEFSKRLQDDFKKKKQFDSLPVLVLISTTAQENSSYRPREVSTAVQYLENRKMRVYVAMTTTIQEADAGQQPVIAIPLVQATGGRYEALSSTSRLTTLLPEFGEEIASLQRQGDQLLVTALRQGGLTGPLQNPRFELMRLKLTAHVSFDGLPSK